MTFSSQRYEADALQLCPCPGCNVIGPGIIVVVLAVGASKTSRKNVECGGEETSVRSHDEMVVIRNAGVTGPLGRSFGCGGLLGFPGGSRPY